MQRVIIVCAGGHARVVADILVRCRAGVSGAQPIGFVDDTPGLRGTLIAGLPVLGPLAALPDLEHDAIIVALGDNALRRQLSEGFVAAGESIVTAVHPQAVVAATATIGAGTVVCAGAVIQPGVTLGRGVIINTMASADHDTTVADFAHLAPGARVGANVRVGEQVLIALGAAVVAERSIGACAVIGAGSVVLDDIPPGVLAFGTPARARAASSPSAHGR